MIKSYEGQTVRSAMIDAIVAQEMQRQRSEREAALEAENARLREELALRRMHDGRIYTRFIEDARRDYPEPERGTLAGKIAWALLGWIVLGFTSLFEGLGM